MIRRAFRMLALLCAGVIITTVVTALSIVLSRQDYATAWWAEPNELSWVDCQAITDVCDPPIVFPWMNNEPQPCLRGFVMIGLKGSGTREEHALATHTHGFNDASEYLPEDAADLVGQILRDYIGAGQTTFPVAVHRLADMLDTSDQVLIEAGWPLASFSGQRNYDGTDYQSPVSTWSGCLEIKMPWDPNDQKKYIPLRPVWAGLILNSLLYALVFWLLLCAGQLRRPLRFRRGVCPTCNYPIGVSEVCTECGVELAEWALKRARSRHPEAVR